MKKITTILTASVLILSMLFAGCSKSEEARSNRSSHNDSEPVTVETMAAAAEYGYGLEDYYCEEDAASVNDVRGTSSNHSSATDNRMLIRRVTLSCETTNYNQVVSELMDRVHNYGGYVESSNGNTVNGELRHVTYTIRIPSDSLDGVIAGIGDNATITSSSESTEDVTLQYADTEAMIESLRIEQETLNELLAQADSLDTLLILQNELTSVRYQIESYESQLRVLENQSSLSTLTVTINEVLEEVAVEEPHVKTYGEKIAETYDRMLERTKTFFEELFLSIIDNLPGIIVFVVIVLAVVITVKVLVAKRKKKLKKIEAVKDVKNT